MKEGNDDITYSLNIDGSSVKFVKDTANTTSTRSVSSATNATQMITNTLPDAIGDTMIYYNPNTGKFSTLRDSTSSTTV